MHHSLTSIVRIPLFCSLMLLAPLLSAEEQAVSPDINSYFQNPDWRQWVNTFERPGREVFDKRHAIVAASGVKPGMVVADIGAGTGLFTRLFADRVGAAGKVYAVDISRPFVENILRTSREQGFINVVGIVNSDKDVSLPADSIDIAFLVDTYHHFEYPVSMLASIRRSLGAGGALIIIDFRRDPHRSSNWVMDHVRAGKDAVIDEVTRAGFQLIHDKPLLRTNYYLVFRKSLLKNS
ncbi:MAG TPA: SAM-dependent methyltransferase [Gammaproteobacteria bacterium]|nr:SAM-dependent methyltransferase [Gammaproteobacteria bacterium]